MKKPYIIKSKSKKEREYLLGNIIQGYKCHVVMTHYEKLENVISEIFEPIDLIVVKDCPVIFNYMFYAKYIKEGIKIKNKFIFIQFIFTTEKEPVYSFIPVLDLDKIKLQCVFLNENYISELKLRIKNRGITTLFPEYQEEYDIKQLIYERNFIQSEMIYNQLAINSPSKNYKWDWYGIVKLVIISLLLSIILSLLFK